MHLLPTEEMERKLSQSWAFVSGADFHFRESETYTFHNHENLMAVILPLYINKQPHIESIAVGLIIDHQEAVKVAAHMFGLSPEDLSVEDIQDAKKETCNILGGGLVTDARCELGLPKEIPLDRFFDLQKTASFSKLFVSDKPNQDLVNLVIFNVNNNLRAGEFVS